MLAILNWQNFIFNHPAEPSTRIFWPYLLSAFLIGGLVFLFQVETPRKSLKSLLAYLFPKDIYTHKSARLDYIAFFSNQAIMVLIPFTFVLSGPLFAKYTKLSLTYLFGAPPVQFSSSLTNKIILTIVVALFLDFAQFISHYCLHRFTFLWNFHKAHHSAEVLTPITLYRTHPVELIFISNCSALCAAFAFGLINYFAETPMGQVKILQLNFVIFFFNFIGNNLNHSHIWLAYPSFLSYFLLSPAQHQIHHSANPIHFNKNLGSGFAFWDYLFGSLYIPKGREKFEIGLPEFEHKQFSTLTGFYLAPFWQNFRRIFKRRPKGEIPKAMIERA